MSFKPRLSLLHFALISIIISIVAQQYFDSWRVRNPKTVTATLNEFLEPQPLQSEYAQFVSFGAREFLADWYWLNLIQYYGGGDPQGQYRKLAELFDLVTTLSPKFTAPYRTGLLILPGEGFVDEALRLGEKGKKDQPQNWEIPYYTGLIYHLHKKDYAAAAKEFEQAASLPGAPESARLFAAVYYKEADQKTTAYQIFKTIYESTEDEYVRERAKNYVIHLEMISQLEAAVGTFYTRNNRYPSSIDELVSANIISEIPKSPLERIFIVDPDTGAVTDEKP